MKMTVLIVSTQNWLQPARLALRLAKSAADVQAICPAGSQLSRVNVVSTTYAFRTTNPLGSLHSAIEKSGATYLLPTDDRAVFFLHSLVDLYPEHLAVVTRSLGPTGSFALVRSRTALLALAQNLGIAVPPTQSIASEEEARQYALTSAGSFFLKKDGTWGGGGVRHVSDQQEALAGYRTLTAKMSLRERWRLRLRHGDRTAFACTANDEEISAQRTVHGVAANAMFACHQGRIVGSVQVRVVGSRGRTGPALMVEVINDARIAAAGALLAASLKLDGFFGLDFIVEEETGIPYLIEMNPRSTQLGHIAVAGQPDLAGALWSAWSGEPAPHCGDSSLGTRISFFPQALQWAADSPFVQQSRFDVCLEDLAAVKELAAAPPSLATRLVRVTRRSVAGAANSLRSKPAPVPVRAVHYFSEKDAREAANAILARQRQEALAASLPVHRNELVQLRLSAPALPA